VVGGTFVGALVGGAAGGAPQAVTIKLSAISVVKIREVFFISFFSFPMAA
jgi:hypothetical protein